MAPPPIQQKYSAAYVGSSAPSITGCDMIGHIAVVTDPSFSSWSSASFVGGLLFLETVVGYVIISDSNTAGIVGRTTGGGTTPDEPRDKPTYWVSATKDDAGFLTLVNSLPPSLDGNGYNTPTTTPPGGRPYYDNTPGFQPADAKIWLNQNGYWTSYP